MDRADRQGLGAALAGHLAIILALVFGLFAPKPVRLPVADTMTVQLVEEVAPRSAARKKSREAPAPPKAEEAGKPEEAAPPAPAPAPPKPAPPKPAPPEPAPPKPAPPKPAPPKPAPPKPTPPKPAPPKPTPKPAPEPKPVPKPAPKPKPKPTPAKPEPAKTPAEPSAKSAKPDKTAKPEKAETTQTTTKAAKAAPAKPAKPGKAASSDKDFTLPSDLRGNGKSGKAAKRTGSLLGNDFSKDIAALNKEAKGSAPPASQVGARAMSGLIGIIAAQVKPCYNPPAGGAGAGQIVTVLSIRMNRDGSVASVTAGSQTGVNEGNGAYAKQMADAARRAVLRCSPLKLPAELYEGGWDDFDFRFRPEQMQ